MFRPRQHFPVWQIVIILLSALTFFSPAGAEERDYEVQRGDWLLRLKITGLIPTQEKSSAAPIGGHLDMPSTILPTLDLSYFLTDHWAVEISGGTLSNDYRLHDSLLGDLEVGSIKSGSVSLVAQYHFHPDSPLKPWLGIGINHTWPMDIDPAEEIPDFDASRLTSPLLDAGLDYWLWGPWFASASLRYLMLPTQHFEGEGFRARARANVFIMNAGLGLRF